MLRLIPALVVVLVLSVIAVHPCLAQNSSKLVGTWSVVSFEVECQATGTREAIYGKNPTGHHIYTSEGRTMELMTREGLKAAATDQDRANLYKSMVAYGGTYRVEGDKIITKIDVSSMPAWVGTERVVFFLMDGDRLQTTQAEWVAAPLNPERGKMRTVTTWQRVK